MHNTHLPRDWIIRLERQRRFRENDNAVIVKHVYTATTLLRNI